MGVNSFSKHAARLFFLFLFCHLQGAEFEIRLAGFFPQDDLFQEIYGTVMPSYQFESSWDLNYTLKAWGNVTYLNPSGNSVPLGTETKLRMVPLSLGLKSVFLLLKTCEVSAGMGACYTWLKETNQSDYIPRSNTVQNFGGIVKTSIEKKISRLKVSIFADYLLQTTHQDNSTGNIVVDLSGLFLGVGVGGTY